MMHAGQHARHPRVQPIPVEPDRRARREDAHPIRQACVMEGVRCEAAEMDADYIRLIRERMGRDMQTGLF